MEIIVETFRAVGEPSSASLRVRPLPGQGFDTALRVECSRPMRQGYPVGQRFKLWVSLKYREDGPLYLYSNYRRPWTAVSNEEAEKFIAETFRTRTLN